MAGNIFVANSTAETLLASSSEKWLVQIITPSSQTIKIKEWGVFFDGVSVTAEPVLCRLIASNSSFGSWTTHTPKRRAGYITASACTVRTMNTSSNGDSSGVYATREVHPQSGYQEKFSFGDEITVSGGAMITMAINSPSSVNVIGEIVYEE